MSRCGRSCVEGGAIYVAFNLGVWLTTYVIVEDIVEWLGGTETYGTPSGNRSSSCLTIAAFLRFALTL